MLEKEYIVAVASFTYFGPARIKLLLSYFKTAKNVWECSYDELREIGLSDKKIKEYLGHRKRFDINLYFRRLSKLNIKITTFLDSDFPENLKNLEDGPVILYYKGSLTALRKTSVAIVGTRKMTYYGREVTEKFASELSSFGITIISGLARGVDTVAHKASISAGGATVAVLGNGLDSVYPLENKTLADVIVEKGGALISEFPLGYPALPVNFAIRNRIVSGLSDAVIVIEGAEKSGTLLTASHAAEQGKTVFAVPGQIFSPLSKAPFFLIKNGAKMATEVKDVLEELDLNVRVDKEKVEKLIPKSAEEAKIIKYLEDEPLFLDELVRITGSQTSEISARLTIMEMKGLVKNLGGGKYRKCN